MPPATLTKEVVVMTPVGVILTVSDHVSTRPSAHSDKRLLSGKLLAAIDHERKERCLVARDEVERIGARGIGPTSPDAKSTRTKLNVTTHTPPPRTHTHTHIQPHHIPMASGSEILEQQVAALKHELKTWEKSFAAQNGGRKPSRDDIKADASASAKYLEYDRLRRPTSFAKPENLTPRKERQRQVRPGSAHKRTALRERSGNGNGNGNVIATTPKKAAKGAIALQVVEEEEEVEPTPAFIRCALGPTPQKDGQVLGIFDMPAATPSKASLATTMLELPTVSGTPSKTAAGPPSSAPLASDATPRSTSKRRLFEAFAGTPLKRKRSANDDDGGHNTPSNSAKRQLQFATPSFLRRAFPLAPIDEESSAAAGPPFAKRGFVRSLSSIIKGLRKQEEERMEDEWDILDELEAEERGEVPQPKPAAASRVLVGDSQQVASAGIEMPLGPDQGPQDSESEDEPSAAQRQPALDANGKPRKPWKKKGLKRQTKRSNMKPVLHKPQKAAGDVEMEEEGNSDEETVAETQQTDALPTLRLRNIKPSAQTEDGDEASGDEDAASEYADDDEGDIAEAPAPRPDKKSSKPSSAAPAKKTSVADEAKPEKPRKKISAQSHANYRTLKIKNKNSKGNGKGGRKFGGRR